MQSRRSNKTPLSELIRFSETQLYSTALYVRLSSDRLSDSAAAIVWPFKSN